ncbi:unnamed protein product [Effrenium voratum]|uniref:PABC domain-containing protein n=1 Tax=Effrenium voratum TaxID=2562239 RepID=A0AA36MMR6_9DINO|nr:unnamed protein product [Effrenium voratum]CAJ1421416.1 unnamed protein product [Effrenium voratum]
MSHELGNALFAVVQQVQPELAPKLTGMLLQLGEEKCRTCLDDYEYLAERLDEAMAILDGANAHAQASKPTTPASEKRVDPEDGTSRTFVELQKHYAKQYSQQEIKEYWEFCKPAGAIAQNGTAKAMGKPEPQSKPAPASTPKPAASTPKPAASTPKPAASTPKPAASKPASKAAANSVPKAAPKPEPKPEPVTPKPASSPPRSKAPKEAVPGLAAWLAELRLESYLPAAEQWAEEQGAVSLEEVVEFREDLAQDLTLKVLERKRLVDGGEAAAQLVESQPAEEEEEDEEEEDGDELQEGRYAQLDTERDLAALSRVDSEPPSHASPAELRGQARPPRGQGFSAGDEVGATGGYYDKSIPAKKSEEAPQERRIDPEDGQARTFRELQALYTHLYSPQEILEYWTECEAPAKTTSAPTSAPKTTSAPVAAPSGYKSGTTPGAQPWGAGEKRRF